jgi:sensor histidine kinase YesM
LKPKVRTFLLHTLWGTLLALFLIFIFHYFSDDGGPDYEGIKSILMPLWIIVLVNLMFRGLIQLDRWLEKSIPWFFYPKRRLAIEIAIALPAMLIILSLNYRLLHALSDHPVETLSHRQFLYTYIIIMIVLGVAMTLVIATRFFRNWRQSFMEVEQLKREKMKSDYQALQNQLNPHFLFNNFNMLVSEIRRDPDNAVLITEKLSDVYRYVLESKNHETVQLGEEVEFVEAIIFLHEVRFGDNLVVDFELPVEVMENRLPPLTLQILFENALKHNVVSAAYPLHIAVGVEEDYLVVTNNVQPRKSTYSTGMGLENIKMRYAYLTERKVTVKADEERFKVMVPLLKEI